MPAPKKNNYNAALKNKEIKEKVYKDYCDHLAKGKMARSWCYNKDGIQLTYESMERYIREDEDLDPAKKKLAVIEGLKIWEGHCEDGALCHREVNTACLQMVMRNKFGWDKVEKEEQKDPNIIVERKKPDES